MFSLGVSLVGLSLVVAYTINVASETIARERLQHAADAAAYATGVWMARGMNGVAALNHQMGQQNAFLALSEAMFGPESQSGTFALSWEEAQMNEALRKLREETPNRNKDAAALTQRLLANLDIDSEKNRLGGAFYDATLTLKYHTAVGLDYLAIAGELKSADRLAGTGIYYYAIDPVEKFFLDGPRAFVGNFNLANMLPGEVQAALQNATGQIQKALEPVDDLLQKGEGALDKVDETLDKADEMVEKLENVTDVWNGLCEEIAAVEGKIKEQISETWLARLSKWLRENGKKIDEFQRDRLTSIIENLENWGQINISGSWAVPIGTNNKINVDRTVDVEKMVADSGRVGEELVKIRKETTDVLKDIREFQSRTNELMQAFADVCDALDELFEDLENLNRELAEIIEPIEEIQKELKEGINSARDAVDNVRELGDQVSQISDAIKNPMESIGNAVSGAIDDAFDDLIGGGGGGVSGFGAEARELRGLLERIKSGKIAEFGEAQDNVESLHEQSSQIAGADEKKSADKREPNQNVAATFESLKETYNVDAFAFAPSDTLVSPSVAAIDGTKPSETWNESKFPLLPVALEQKLAEPNVAPSSSSNASNKLWSVRAQINVAKARFDRLPKSPWEERGEDDKASYVEAMERTYDVFDALIVASKIQLAARGTAYLGSWKTWHKAVKTFRHLRNVCKLEDIVKNKRNWRPGKYGYPNNPSVWSYPVGEFDYEKAKTSQWVRAVYPTLDYLRSGLRKHYKQEARLSNLSTYLTVWSYRYALSEAYYSTDGAARPYGIKSGVGRVYVIAGTARPYKDASGREVTPGKGSEPIWRPKGDPQKSEADERALDEMFSVCVVAQAKRRNSLAGAGIFKRFGSSNDANAATAVAQATFYPINGRNMPDADAGNFQSGESSDQDRYYQPNSAWDTLQWKNQNPDDPYRVKALEWKSQPTTGPRSWSYQALIDDKVGDLRDPNVGVDLSWQAMLRPVSKSALLKVANSKDPNTTDAMKKAAKATANGIDAVCF